MNTLKKSSTTKFIILIILLAAALVLSIAVGSTKLRLGEACLGLIRGENSAQTRILLYVRLPRTLASVLCGAGLAVSGVILQGVLQNPLAAPNIIGVNAGAGFAALLCIAVLPHMAALVPLAAFFGALCAVLFVCAVSLRHSVNRLTVVLAGVAVSAVLTAGTNTVKLLFPDINLGTTGFFIGGFSGVTLTTLLNVTPYIVLCILAVWLCAPVLDIISLGDDNAKSLGLNATQARLILICVCAMLCGAVVSFAGLVGFVGLVVPHIARRFFGHSHKKLIPAAALMGMLLVSLCDTLSRVIFAPFELPVGILLSLVGGAFFIYLLVGGKKSDRM